MFLICGEALFDVFLQAGQARWPALDYRAVPGGSPFNVAIGLARLGQLSALLGAVSTDFLGQQLRAVLQQENVNTDYLLQRALPTTLALVSLDAGGHPQYAFYGDKAPEASLTDAELPQPDDSVTGIHFGSYALVRSPTAEALSTLLQQESGRRLCTLDPNIRLNVEPDLQRWREVIEHHAGLVDLIKVSDEDLQLLYPGTAPESTVRRWLNGRCQLVLMTRGGDGVSVFSRAHGEWQQPAANVSVVDTVGAGDTFQAALLCHLAEHGLASQQGVAGLSRAQIDDMVQFATRAAALTCSRRGPDLPRRDELNVPGSHLSMVPPENSLSPL